MAKKYHVVIEFKDFAKTYTCDEVPEERDGRLYFTDRDGEKYSFSLDKVVHWHYNGDGR